MVSELTHGDLASRLWRVRRTCCQMLHDRNYMISPLDIDMPLEEFKSKYNGDSNNIRIEACKTDNPTDKVMVFFPEEPKLNVKLLQQYFEIMVEASVNRGILVIQNSITPLALKMCKEMKDRVNIEQFLQQELLVNITHHVLVPQHIVLKEPQKQELLRIYKVKESQLPRIQTSDPVARYYGLTRGQVVKIVRPSETAGQYISYRLVS